MIPPEKRPRELLHPLAHLKDRDVFGDVWSPPRPCGITSGLSICLALHSARTFTSVIAGRVLRNEVDLAEDRQT